MVTVATGVCSWKGLKPNNARIFDTDNWKSSFSSGKVSSIIEMLAQCLLFVADSVTSCRYVSWSLVPEVVWNEALQMISILLLESQQTFYVESTNKPIVHVHRRAA